MNFGDIIKALTTLQKNIHAEAGRTKKNAHLAINGVVKDQHTRNLLYQAIDAEIDKVEARILNFLETL